MSRCVLRFRLNLAWVRRHVGGANIWVGAGGLRQAGRWTRDDCSNPKRASRRARQLLRADACGVRQQLAACERDLSENRRRASPAAHVRRNDIRRSSQTRGRAGGDDRCGRSRGALRLDDRDEGTALPTFTRIRRRAT